MDPHFSAGSHVRIIGKGLVLSDLHAFFVLEDDLIILPYLASALAPNLCCKRIGASQFRPVTIIGLLRCNPA